MIERLVTTRTSEVLQVGTAVYFRYRLALKYKFRDLQRYQLYIGNCAVWILRGRRERDKSIKGQRRGEKGVKDEDRFI